MSHPCWSTVAASPVRNQPPAVHPSPPRPTGPPSSASQYPSDQGQPPHESTFRLNLDSISAVIMIRGDMHLRSGSRDHTTQSGGGDIEASACVRRHQASALDPVKVGGRRAAEPRAGGRPAWKTQSPRMSTSPASAPSRRTGTSTAAAPSHTTSSCACGTTRPARTSSRAVLTQLKIESKIENGSSTCSFKR